MADRPSRKPKPSPDAERDRLTKHVIRKPDGRYLILYEPRKQRDRDR